MTRTYLLLGVVLALGCASCDREKQQSLTQPSTSPQATVPATATVANVVDKKNSPATQQANDVTSPDGAAEFKPDDLKRLTREHGRWIGSVTKVDTAKKRIEVLLYSESDTKGNEKVFIAVVTSPESGIVIPSVGDKVTVEGMLGDEFVSETEGVFKGFDQIGRTTITVPCTFAQKGMQPHMISAPTETVEAIEVSIAISTQVSVQGFPCPISDRLKALIKKYDAETVMGGVAAGTECLNKGNGWAIELNEDWGTPFSFPPADSIPAVKFRKGEIGIVDKEIYVKFGTQAMVGKDAFVYTDRQWNALSLEAPATKPAVPELNRPANAEIEKLITDACIADRPSLEGYTAQINIKNVIADTQDKGKYTVTADVAFASDGTRARLGYIDHFVILRDVKNAWSIEIIKAK